MTDPREWLEDLDAPRPLPPGLRARLEAQLTTESARPLGSALEARLAEQLTDPVADLLHDLDALRELSPELRAALVDGLVSSRRRAWWLAASAAAAVAAVTVVALVLTGSPPVAPGQDIAAGPSVTRATATRPPGSGAFAGGQVRPPTPTTSAVPDSAVVAPPAAVAGPAPTPDSSFGYYRPGAEPAAMPPEGAPAPQQQPHPEVTSRTPDAGPLAGGTLVRINGSRLGTAVSVVFGDVPGRELRVVDDSHLTVVTPAHDAGTVEMIVRFENGGEFVVRDGFTFLKAPHLESVSPSSGSAGSWVVLTGDALSRVTVVRFGDAAAQTVQVLSDTKLRALVPAHALGPVDVTATSPGGTSNAVRYLYLP